MFSAWNGPLYCPPRVESCEMNRKSRIDWHVECQVMDIPVGMTAELYPCPFTGECLAYVITSRPVAPQATQFTIEWGVAVGQQPSRTRPIFFRTTVRMCPLCKWCHVLDFIHSLKPRQAKEDRSKYLDSEQ